MHARHPFPPGINIVSLCLHPLDTTSVNLYLDLQKELDYVDFKVRAFFGEEEYNILHCQL